MEPVAAHLALVRGVIARMAQNSFLIRGWTVSLTTALLGLSAADDNTGLAWNAVVAVAVFGALDAYYLALERAYRDLYAAAVDGSAAPWSLAAPAVGRTAVGNALLSASVTLPMGQR